MRKFSNVRQLGENLRSNLVESRIPIRVDLFHDGADPAVYILGVRLERGELRLLRRAYKEAM